MGNNYRNVFLDESDSLRTIWFIIIVVITMFVLVLICLTFDRLSCERSSEVIADDYHYGWLEGCFYELDGIMVSRSNYNELYKKQELTLKGELKLNGR